MRILTVVAQVPDAEQRLTITNSRVDLGQCKTVMDTMDEYGVEEALRLREAGLDTEIVAVAVGPARVEEVLRAGLALGADRGVLVESDSELDVIALSAVVAGVAKAEEVNLVFCGGQQADSDSQALGPAVAERLNWPQVTWTNALVLQDGVLTGKHDVDSGVESFSVPLPAVITTQQGLNEPRYPTLPGIMKARKKEVRRESAEGYAKPKLRVMGAEVQVRKRLRKMIDASDPALGAAEFRQFLQNEAKVIA